MATRRAYYEGGVGDLVKWYRGKIEKIEDGNSHIVAEAAERGAEIAKHHIETRGIQKRGRIDTGRMRDSISSRVIEDSAGRTQAHFGWIDTQEYYFGLQEGGFTHTGGVTVPGMYAIVDAAEEVFTDMREDIRRNVKDA